MKNTHRNQALNLYNDRHKLTAILSTASVFTSSVVSYINHFLASMETEALLFSRRKCMRMLCVFHINYPGVLIHPGGFFIPFGKTERKQPKG